MPAELLFAMIAFAFVASVTPGPNNLMLLASGVNFGFRRTIPHMLGIGIGFTVMLLAVGLGVSRVFEAWPPLHTVLKVASLLYMLWLAWQIATAGGLSSTVDGGTARPMTFLAAALFQWVNPKAWAIMLSGVAAFTEPSSSLTGVVVLALVFGAVNLPSVSIWAAFGAALRGWLQAPHRLRLFNVTMALVLVASVVPVMIELYAAATRALGNAPG